MATKKRKLPDKLPKIEKKGKREIDKLTKDVWSSWKDSVVLISKREIRTWHGVFAIAFATGIIAAVVSSVYLNIQSRSGADEGSSLALEAMDNYASLRETDEENMVYLDVTLDSHGNDVVAVKAEVNYDPEYFELQSYDTTTTSLFATDNICTYEGEHCQIINEDPDNGKITITVAKPSPGVSTTSGSSSFIALLVFKAIKVTAPTSPNFTLSYTPGSYEDSDVIADDGLGTDILNSVTNETVSVYDTICEDFNYEPTEPCQPGGNQKIKVISGIPDGCGGGDPELTQSCDYKEDTIPCTDKFTYTDWGACQLDGTQSRTETSRTPAGCSGGVEPKLTQSCEYIPAKNASSCASFTYSKWSDCQSNEKQSRTVTSSTPAGCSGGVSPELTQSCEYEEEDKEDPKIKDLPAFLKKHRGEKIWWKGTDNEGIDHYTYNFNGKKVKTHRKHFFIPASTPKGVYVLRVKAYDKAGNSKSKLSTIVIY